MKPRSASNPFILLVFVLAALLAGAAHAKETVPVAKHIILFIGDGMHLENEIAAGRYLTGRDEGLSFHAFPYRAWVATWDVTVYNRHARRSGAPAYNPSAVNPKFGCDAAQRLFEDLGRLAAGNEVAIVDDDGRHPVDPV